MIEVHLTILKYMPHRADVPLIYLLTKHSHSSGSKFSQGAYTVAAPIERQRSVEF